MTHTYAIVKHSATFNLEWTGIDAATYGKRCSCGYLSSVNHPTIESAHAEPTHSRDNRNRRIAIPVFDGTVTTER